MKQMAKLSAIFLHVGGGSSAGLGRSIDILVAIDTTGIVAGATLVHPDEPILTIGASPGDFEEFVSGFVGIDAGKSSRDFGETSDGIDGRRRSDPFNGVIRDAIGVHGSAPSRGRGGAPGGIGTVDRVAFAAATWTHLAAEDDDPR